MTDIEETEPRGVARTRDLPFRDATLPIDRRVEDLLDRMSVEDKAGTMFHTMTTYGPLDERDTSFGLPSLESMVVKRRMNHFNLVGSLSTARELAGWANAAQRLALDTGLGIPLTLSSDPRHSFTDNPGAGMEAGPLSEWPESLGFAALRDPERLREFADVVRQEYVAIGLRVALHPQIDLATEPRWARIAGTFGEDADLTSQLVVAYLDGLRAGRLGPDSVAGMVKHFPGGGPQKDGEDPHFPYGREQIYPGGRFDYHLEPFRAAIAAGATQMMPYYGMPVGTQYEEVGFGFNKQILTDLLRDELGFSGIICTDWGLLSDANVLGSLMVARAWGVEDLTVDQRMRKALDAGVDQFGGELCTNVLLDLVRSGQVPEARLDVSVRRLLAEKFRLGLFDAPFVDEGAAEVLVGSSPFREAGARAQRDALTLLVNGRDGADPALPLAPGRRIWVEGVAEDVAARFGTVVEDPADADVAVIRIKAPYEPRSGGLQSFFHAGSLEFAPETIAHIAEIAVVVPTVVDVYLDRPALLGELPDTVAALLVDFGAGDAALLDVLFGSSSPQGRLPFDIPRSTAAIVASRSDVPFDTEDPVFRFGDGLSYAG